MPFASRAVAVACVDWPIKIDALLKVTVTLATTAGAGAVTVRLALPLLPDDVAVIVALPAPMPVARPLDETVMTAGFDELHEIAAF